MDDDPILTTTEVARLLGVATSTVQVWMENGLIESWKTPGGHRRTRQSHLLAAWLEVSAPAKKRQGRRAPPLDPEFLLDEYARLPMREDDAQRLVAVASLNLIGTPPEERFDRIVRIASRITRSPIALIAFLTAERQWFKAQVGLRVQQIPRAWSFCAYTIAESSPFVIENAVLDARFRNNPLVLADPHIRFYAGVSVCDANGITVGTLCVMDREPRKLRVSELQALRDLGEMVGREIFSSVAGQR